MSLSDDSLKPATDDPAKTEFDGKAAYEILTAICEIGTSRQRHSRNEKAATVYQEPLPIAKCRSQRAGVYRPPPGKRFAGSNDKLDRPVSSGATKTAFVVLPL